MEIHSLLQRYIDGDATPEERRKILLWLDEDESHMEEYRTLRRLHNLQTWNIPGQKIHPATRIIRRTTTFRQIAINFLKIASVFLVGVLMTLFISREESQDLQYQTISVPSGQRTELQLSDGTEVWLNSGTKLLFPNQFSRKSRDVTLDDGEAYFRVAKNERKPFVVRMGSYNVRVLGTEFNVKTNKENGYFETSLLEGLVEIETSEGVKVDRLKKNEILSIRDGAISKKEVNDLDYYRWREGLICFNDENVGSILKKVELYYDVRFEIHNPALLTFKFKGKFRISDGAEHLLKALQLRFRFSYTRDEESNVIVIR